MNVSSNMLMHLKVAQCDMSMYFNVKERNVIRGSEEGSENVSLHLLWQEVRNKLSWKFFTEGFGLDLGRVSRQRSRPCVSDMIKVGSILTRRLWRTMHFRSSTICYPFLRPHVVGHRNGCHCACEPCKQRRIIFPPIWLKSLFVRDSALSKGLIPVA